jgi:hypothetical protein
VHVLRYPPARRGGHPSFLNQEFSVFHFICVLFSALGESAIVRGTANDLNGLSFLIWTTLSHSLPTIRLPIRSLLFRQAAGASFNAIHRHPRWWATYPVDLSVALLSLYISPSRQTSSRAKELRALVSRSYTTTFRMPTGDTAVLLGSLELTLRCRRSYCVRNSMIQGEMRHATHPST